MDRRFQLQPVYTALAALVNPGTTHGLELLPEDVPADAASLFVMPAVGLERC